jgi:hypothetical protein
MCSPDDGLMSIDVREPGSHPPQGSRAGSTATVGGLRPSGDLLPSGGAPAPAPAPTPQRALALDALHLLRHLRASTAAEASWSDVSFGRQVEATRRQLAPIRSRTGLAASFGREAFHVRRFGFGIDDGDPLIAETPGPVRLAYALRWMELGDGRPRPPWSDLPYRKMFSTR